VKLSRSAAHLPGASADPQRTCPEPQGIRSAVARRPLARSPRIAREAPRTRAVHLDGLPCTVHPRHTIAPWER